MKWKKFTIETTSEAEDLVCGMLAELGVESVEIEDRQHITPEEQAQMHIGFLPELPEDDGKAYISFYIEVSEAAEPEQCRPGSEQGLHTEQAQGVSKDQECAGQKMNAEQQLLTQIREELYAMSAYADVGACRITESFTEDTDWINNWKQYFKPFMVDDVLIRPSWYRADGVNDEENEVLAESSRCGVCETAPSIVIEMDPGTAFGTGMHESTQLILRQLKRYVTPDTKLLDVGCGSGILSILALKLGAAFAAGIDIEEAAICATVENMAANGIPGDRYKVRQGNLLDEERKKPVSDETGKAAAAGSAGAEESLDQWVGYGEYDLAVANILADVVIAMASVVGKYLRKGGLFITSGILCTQEEAVKQALTENGFQIMDITRQNDWASVTGKLISSSDSGMDTEKY